MVEDPNHKRLGFKAYLFVEIAIPKISRDKVIHKSLTYVLESLDKKVLGQCQV
jgi:hypothetical protein